MREVGYIPTLCCVLSTLADRMMPKRNFGLLLIVFAAHVKSSVAVDCAEWAGHQGSTDRFESPNTRSTGTSGVIRTTGRLWPTELAFVAAATDRGRDQLRAIGPFENVGRNACG